MIAAYFVYSGFSKGAQEGLDFFGKMRTKNAKGVTIPSQMRYVHYFEVLRTCSLSRPYNGLHCSDRTTAI